LIFQRKPDAPGKNIFCFSTTGELSDAAHNLYAVLRQTDAGKFARMLIESAPRNGGALAAAINDRLTRAAGKRR
jgi:L-threonylcarbamoyladenylate synthase